MDDYARRYARATTVVVPTGARVEWQGRAATVIAGNMGTVWTNYAPTATLSLAFDAYGRNLTHYAEVYADEVTVLDETN